MELFKNSNGREYEIIAQSGDYTLLKQLTETTEPYVVAYDIRENYWLKGRYYSSVREAEQSYIELINKNKN